MHGYLTWTTLSGLERCQILAGFVDCFTEENDEVVHTAAGPATHFPTSWFSHRHAKLALQALHATANPSVRLTVRHTPLLCQNEGTHKGAVFTIG